MVYCIGLFFDKYIRNTKILPVEVCNGCNIYWQEFFPYIWGYAERTATVRLSETVLPLHLGVCR